MKNRRPLMPDMTAMLGLIALWLLFFWRLFTPIESDQAAVEKGDFSGQFVAFGAYQYQRLTAGEVPLWNPYNNGGLPFIADTQAAVFYPPRLATIALSKLSGGWTYHALELEMMVHVLAYSLFIYILARRLLAKSAGSIFGTFVAAVVGSYGGFLSSYPPLQLALLEAAIWLPLAVLGIHEATRGEQPRLSWLLLTGFAFGFSWMAGHPQTSWFLTYLLIGYLAYRVYEKRFRWTTFAIGTAVFGGLAAGMAAAQLLPGLEYLTRTTRADFGYDAKGNGFPFQDMAQFVFPGLVSMFSPLYIGIVGLALAMIALWRRVTGSLFWGVVALAALGLSFGANSAVFAVLYNLLPGLRFFRGQERAAYLIASSLAILAGMGAAQMATWNAEQWPIATRNIRRGLVALLGLCGGAVVLVFNEWVNNHELLNSTLSVVIFSTMIAAATLGLIWGMMARPEEAHYRWLLAGLIVFELFTVNMDAESNYDSVPPTQQLSMTPPALLRPVLEDTSRPFRVDGYRGLHDNYGSLYGVMDIRGISPLFMDGPHTLIQSELINPLAWELLAVRYVYSDWDELPVSSEIIATGEDRYGGVNLHRLTDPRPFALMVYQVVTVEGDQAAYAAMAEAGFEPRRMIILNHDPGIRLDADANFEATAVVEEFQPEQITIRVNSEQQGILSIAQPDYPGWAATIDGQPTALLRAYGALAAVMIPAGEHVVRLVYDPPTYRGGVIISLFTWGSLIALGVGLWIRRGRYARNKRASKLG